MHDNSALLPVNYLWEKCSLSLAYLIPTFSNKDIRLCAAVTNSVFLDLQHPSLVSDLDSIPTRRSKTWWLCNNNYTSLASYARHCRHCMYHHLSPPSSSPPDCENWATRRPAMGLVRAEPLACPASPSRTVFSFLTGSFAAKSIYSVPGQEYFTPYYKIPSQSAGTSCAGC